MTKPKLATDERRGLGPSPRPSATDGSSVDAGAGPTLSQSVFVFTLEGVDCYLSHCPSPFDLIQWRASFPGAGSGASTVSGAISDARALWSRFGKSATGSYCGPAPLRIGIDELLQLAKPWEHETIARLFGVWQGPERRWIAEAVAS